MSFDEKVLKLHIYSQFHTISGLPKSKPHTTVHLLTSRESQLTSTYKLKYSSERKMTSRGVFYHFFLSKKSVGKSILWFKNHATYIYQLFLKSAQYISKSLSLGPPPFSDTTKFLRHDEKRES